MYKCNTCLKFFEEPLKSEIEPDTGYVEQVCPHCGSDYFEEACECPICHDAYTTDDFCEECYRKLNQGLTELRDMLGAGQEDFEQIIANHFGW